MVDCRTMLSALVAAYDQHRKWMMADKFAALQRAVDHARDVLAQPEPAPAADGEVIEGQLISGWLPIDSAPRDGTEILASDYDAIEIVYWYKERNGACASGEWLNREGEIMYPVWWQPLPDHPPLPEVDHG